MDAMTPILGAADLNAWAAEVFINQVPKPSNQARLAELERTAAKHNSEDGAEGYCAPLEGQLEKEQAYPHASLGGGVTDYDEFLEVHRKLMAAKRKTYFQSL
jgi:hypothetical protein